MVGHHIKELERGFVINGFRIKGEPIRGARFREERTLRVEIHDGDHSDQICCAKIFAGRPPFYRAWIELFDIYGSLHIGRKSVEYFGSDLERSILKLFADALGPGENLFVEYYRDQETKQQLHVWESCSMILGSPGSKTGISPRDSWRENKNYRAKKH